MDGLPTLPFGLAEATQTFQRLWDGVEGALEAALPPPDTTNEASYRRFVTDELTPWLEARAEALRVGEGRIMALADAPDAEIAIAHAILAHLYLRTAEAVVRAEVPGEARDPERALALRLAWRDRMAPLFEAADRHFRACATGLSLAAPEHETWRTRCADEAEAGSARHEE